MAKIWKPLGVGVRASRISRRILTVANSNKTRARLRPTAPLPFVLGAGSGNGSACGYSLYIGSWLEGLQTLAECVARVPRCVQGVCPGALREEHIS